MNNFDQARTRLFEVLDRAVDKISPRVAAALSGDSDAFESRRMANSMGVFAAGDATFNIGEWRAWRQACAESGRHLDPAGFKKPKT